MELLELDRSATGSALLESTSSTTTVSKSVPGHSTPKSRRLPGLTFNGPAIETDCVATICLVIVTTGNANGAIDFAEVARRASIFQCKVRRPA